MEHLPTIITDLALLLCVAGVTTILFKKINQPLVLGYIIAGFLTGPNFPFFLTLADKGNIDTWAEIGVIFLMFSLGLEFSFYKLKSVGSTAFIATGVAVGGMMITGYICGGLLGWSQMNSLFLGGMLSMSSTAIIVKAYDEMGLKEEKFAGMVFGVLIIEDIAGIVLLVLLSTIATATAGVSPLELLQGIGKLIFCLVLWFVLGMYLVPSFFKQNQELFNDETLVVVSIGLCLFMVYVASYMGFSSALGAFIMGSLIAESPFADRIEQLMNPIKNLFGAVFFVSVGMLVDPVLLWQYIGPVCFLVLVTICGQIFFGVVGMLAAGQDLHTSVRCGFSLCQIGEFSFIIATLGEQLKVIDSFLYPIIVAVSVITTFTTPFCIKAAIPFYNKLLQVLPPKFLHFLERYTSSKDKDAESDSLWKEFLQHYFISMSIYAILLIAIGIVAELYIRPYFHNDLNVWHGTTIASLITLLLMSPILRAIMIGDSQQGKTFTILWFQKRINHLPLLLLMFGRILMVGMALYFLFHSIIKLHGLFAAIIPLLATYFIFRSNWLLDKYLKIETRFLVNLNEKHMQEHRDIHGDADGKWFDEDLQLTMYKLQPNSPLAGKSLMDSKLRSYFGCNVLQIRSAKQVIDLPGGQELIPAASNLLVIGTQLQLQALESASKDKHFQLEQIMSPVTLKNFMLESNYLPKEQQFLSFAISIKEDSNLLGKTLRQTNIRDEWNCLVIGLERGAYTITNPNVNLTFEKGDLLWILGKQAMVNRLIKKEVI